MDERLADGNADVGGLRTRVEDHREEDASPRTPADGEDSDSFLCRLYAFFNSPNHKSIREETRRFAHFAVYFSLRKCKQRESSKVETCLRRCISRMHEKHAMVFGGMMNRLNINRDINFYHGFNEVSEELFREEISWSKIVALYAFGAKLAQYCQDHEMEELLSDISDSLARFTNQHLTTYIQAQGGWESLCDAFPPENEMEQQVWRSLGLLAVGLATASAFILFRKST